MSNVRSLCITESTTFSDGTSTAPTPGDFASLDVLLGRLARRAHPTGATILLDGPVAARLGLPARAPRKYVTDHPALNDARTVGWRVSSLSPWMTFWRQGVASTPTIHVGILPWLPVRSFPMRAEQDHATTCRRLARFHELTGVPYHGAPTAGLPGVELMRRQTFRRAPRWMDTRDDVPRASEQVYAWQNPDGWLRPGGDPGERYELAHGYDARRQYLAAASVADLAVDQLTHTGPRDELPPGVYEVEVPAWAWGDCAPNPVSMLAPGTRTWVTAPTVRLWRYLAEDHQVMSPPVVFDAWTAPGTRVLRSWAETLRDALKAASEGHQVDPTVIAALKASYAGALGMVDHEGSRVYRPDWTATVVATARTNLFRRVWDQGRAHDQWPCAIEADQVWYAADDPEPEHVWPAMLPRKAGLGGWQHKATRKADEQ